jgi:shikimate dehydrogenase
MVIDPDTRIFGITGHPLGHSLSPLMHNDAFGFVGINAVYLYFPSHDIKAVVRGMKALSIRGLSVTIPHKQTVCACVDELEPIAAKIGAANTLMNIDGRITGYNTDVYGAISALKEKIKDIRGKRVLLIGAGGAARAIGFALVDEGADIIIANRTETRGRSLAKDLNGDFSPLEKLPAGWANIIIQTTSVGMFPKVDACLVPGVILKKGMIVMDVIYNPLETKLLRLAKEKGCITIGGLEMFIRQGARQFMIWTGKEPPIKRMRETVLEFLHKGRG